MQYRKRESSPCAVVSITMSVGEQERLDAIRERFRDESITRVPSRSLMLSMLVDWASKNGFGPKNTGE